jgi:hypothetical protein
MMIPESSPETECVRRESFRRTLSMGCEDDVPSRSRDSSFVRSSPISVIPCSTAERIPERIAGIIPEGEVILEQSEVATLKDHPLSWTNRLAAALQQEELLRFLQRDQVRLLAGIAGWYTFGFVAIITTKVLLTSWEVPPLLLTVQQLLISSTFLRILLFFSKKGSNGIQPWPVEPGIQLDFILIGLFNALDFLASNCGFEGADANFVETIKASEPLTTTIVALSWKIDTLGGAEAGSLGLLFTGVLLSTLGNTQDAASGEGEIAPEALEASVRSTLTVMSANLCFAFRVLCQKRYRAAASATDQLDNTNLLMRMQTTGWTILLLPALFYHFSFFHNSLSIPTDQLMGYVSLSLLNSAAYVIYNLSSCYVLTQVSALQSMGINCLRRMLATIVTCIVFGVSLSTVSVFGIVMCFAGFFLFTVNRNRRLREVVTIKAKDSNV